MEVEVFENQSALGEWRVEAINSDADGGIDVVIFSGPASERRAIEYAIWKYQEEIAAAA